MFNKEGIYFLPLGGADGIGLNLYVYAVDSKLVIVDVGYGFLSDDYPGMDLALIDASFLETYQDSIEGLFITHVHEDHYGAIGHIWPKLKCPVYATQYASILIKHRLKEFELDKTVPIKIAKPEAEIKLKNFTVEFIPITHSAPESSAIFIKTKYGNIFHATDWRFDDSCLKDKTTNYNTLERIKKDGVELFIGDSTNVLVDENNPTEEDIRKSLMELIPTLKNTVVATCFASNTTRLESLVLAAHEAERTPILVGRSLKTHMATAKECGYFKDLPPCYDEFDAKDIPSDKALYICTGSQGDYRSALPRIIGGTHKGVKLSKGDSVIFSSKIIPGNEKKIEAMQDKLVGMGVTVISKETHLVHTTGHATKSELIKMYNLLKPKIVIPVHGERRFVQAHKELARFCGIKETITTRCGDLILIKDGKAVLETEIPTTVLGCDRNQLTPLNSQLVKNRKRLAFNSSVYIGAVFDENWNLDNIEIQSIDVLEEDEFNKLADEIIAKVKELLPSVIDKNRNKKSEVFEFLRSYIRKYIYNITGIKPVTFTHFFKRK